ncbi:Aste57867_21609 [Aphanomyces stellatus]|uniref:Aste57867_21609 protein n=1 Tax=Aphanomyces stellatus TaxID=120398 RepID=A0A485LJB8_9STRA|nr:hypothetical protein As57867_021540 [Aphanomyces stellatus]VFT98279.1 Aste57867_21609 [Aphanomyces stellatus]
MAAASDDHLRPGFPRTHGGGGPRHVLPRDVFKTLVRLEAKVEWNVTDSAVAARLHLPETYVDPIVPPASHFVGPGPGEYDVSQASTRGANASSSSFATNTRRTLHFAPQYVVPRETYRQGPFYVDAPLEAHAALPFVASPQPTTSPSHDGDARRLRRRHNPRRRNALVAPSHSVQLPWTALPDSPLPPCDATRQKAPTYSFPQGPRSDLALQTTPVGVSAATYDVSRTTLEEMEPSRVVVGFQSSVARVPTWMDNPEDVAPADVYRSCVHVVRVDDAWPKPASGGALPSSRSESQLPERRRSSLAAHPDFDAFAWLKTQPDGVDKVAQLKARLADLTTNESNQAAMGMQTDGDDKKDGAAANESVTMQTMAITVVLPRGLACTFRVTPVRTTAALKHMVAKTLAKHATRETRHLGDGGGVERLTLYHEGKKLADDATLGESGVHERSSLVCTIQPPVVAAKSRA